MSESRKAGRACSRMWRTTSLGITAALVATCAIAQSPSPSPAPLLKRVPETKPGAEVLQPVPLKPQGAEKPAQRTPSETPAPGLRRELLLPRTLPATGSSQSAQTVAPVQGATPQQVSQIAQIRQHLASVPRLAIVPPSSTDVDLTGQLPQSYQDANYRARGARVRDAVTHNKLYLFQPVTGSIWPGALIQGKSVSGGAFSVIPLPRGPGRVRLSGGFTSGTLLRDVASAEQAENVRLEMLRSTGATDIASSSVFEFVSAREFSEAMVKLGVAYSGTGASVEGSLRAELQNQETMVVGRFTQVFYSASFEPTALPGMADTRPYFFAANVTLPDVQAYTAGNNPPLYISEVAYGRIIFAVFKAKGSVTDVEGAVKAAYSTVKGNLEARYKQVVDSMSISIIQIGATGANMVNPGKVGDTQTLKQLLTSFIEQGARFNVQTNPGLPIQITLKYVDSGQPDAVAAIQLTTEYLDVVSVDKPPRQCTQHLVWDGPGGGWRRVQLGRGTLYANPGDILSFNYVGGDNWSGVVATGTYAADGWNGWERPRDDVYFGFPIWNASPFGLIGRLGSGDQRGEDPSLPPSRRPGAQPCNQQSKVGCSSAFWIGRSRQVTAGEAINVQWGEVWLGTNDDNPTNGDPNRKWTIEICVDRKDFGQTSTRNSRPTTL